MSTIKFQRLNHAAILPSRGSDGACGLDIHSSESVVLGPGSRQGVRTGLSVAIPEGCYGRIAPRSGLALKHGIDTLAGVVDSDYRGEIVCILINLSDTAFEISSGDRIAQLIIEKYDRLEPEWADMLEVTARNTGGFGSTGR
jgi:dUTP pyrophosphatase